MDNPIDNPIDLGLVNYVRHPENSNYVVFRFTDPNRASSFEQELTSNGIWFEKGEEERRQKTIVLFGIHKQDYKKCERINFTVEAMHKKPMIPFRVLRYSLYLFSAFVLTLAILGYCEAQKKLRTVNKSDTSINGLRKHK